MINGERSSFANLVVMRKPHHQLIDVKEPAFVARRAVQDRMNASRSGLRTSACVVSMPCG